jgi:hypothetical protein
MPQGWVRAGTYFKGSDLYRVFLCPDCAPDAERYRALVALREGVMVE